MANYEQSGVNVEAGNNLSRILYEAAKLTWDNRQGRFGEVREMHSSFSGFRAMPLETLGSTKGMFANLGSDGVGTKVEIAERTQNHSTIAFDLFAMVCDDAVVRGAEPVGIVTTLDVRKLDLENNPGAWRAVSQLAEGYVAAAQASDTVILNGEVAELGDRVGGFRIQDNDLNYNWAATVLWVAHEDRILTGNKIQLGHSLVGLAEHGFRSNGMSLARKILSQKMGEDWHLTQVDPNNTIGSMVQQPSAIYSRFITKLTGGYDIQKPPLADISGIAHITGGGLPDKLRRMLEPSGYGAVIDNPHLPPDIMQFVQAIGDVSDREAYSTWNMGQGMVIATPEPDNILRLADEAGLQAKTIGEVRPSGFHIKNRGVFNRSDWLTF